MRCRRCLSPQLRQLARASARDPYVFPCNECSFIFSPPDSVAAENSGSPPAPEWPLSWEALARMLAGPGSRTEEG